MTVEKSSVVRLVQQYLLSHGFPGSASLLAAESGVALGAVRRRAQLVDAVMDGAWAAILTHVEHFGWSFPLLCDLYEQIVLELCTDGDRQLACSMLRNVDVLLEMRTLCEHALVKNSSSHECDRTAGAASSWWGECDIAQRVGHMDAMSAKPSTLEQVTGDKGVSASKSFMFRGLPSHSWSTRLGRRTRLAESLAAAVDELPCDNEVADRLTLILCEVATLRAGSKGLRSCVNKMTYDVFLDKLVDATTSGTDVDATGSSDVPAAGRAHADVQVSEGVAVVAGEVFCLGHIETILPTQHLRLQSLVVCSVLVRGRGRDIPLVALCTSAGSICFAYIGRGAVGAVAPAQVGASGPVYTPARAPIVCARVSPTSRGLVAVGDVTGSVYVYRVDDSGPGLVAQFANIHGDAVSDLQFVPSERMLISASYDGTVRVLRVADGVCEKSFLVSEHRCRPKTGLAGTRGAGADARAQSATAGPTGIGAGAREDVCVCLGVASGGDVVYGGTTSGCVLAWRLSTARPLFSVLVAPGQTARPVRELIIIPARYRHVLHVSPSYDARGGLDSDMHRTLGVQHEVLRRVGTLNGGADAQAHVGDVAVVVTNNDTMVRVIDLASGTLFAKYSSHSVSARMSTSVQLQRAVGSSAEEASAAADPVRCAAVIVKEDCDSSGWTQSGDLDLQLVFGTSQGLLYAISLQTGLQTAVQRGTEDGGEVVALSCISVQGSGGKGNGGEERVSVNSSYCSSLSGDGTIRLWA